jgi:predicted RNA binding protein YcfA (HicA-like mRNA interferase family)
VDRIIARLRRHPPQAGFADVRQVLEAFDWALDHETGSHAIFVKRGDGQISIPKVGGRRVKGSYVKLMLRRLGLE